MLRILRLDEAALVAGGEMLEIEDAEQVVPDLDQHAPLEPCRLYGSHWFISAQKHQDRSTGPAQPCYDPQGHALRSAARPARLAGTARAPRRPSTRPPGRRRSTSTKPPIATSSRRSCPGSTPRPDRARPRRTTGSPSAAPRRRRRRRRPARPLPPGRARPRLVLARPSNSPTPSTMTAITADLRDGVLTVTLPKSASAAAHHRGAMMPTHRSSPFLFVDLRLRRRPGPDRPSPQRRRSARGTAPGAGRRSRSPRPAAAGALPGPLGGRRAHDSERDEHRVAADRPARRTRRSPPTRSSATSSATG